MNYTFQADRSAALSSGTSEEDFWTVLDAGPQLAGKENAGERNSVKRPLGSPFPSPEPPQDPSDPSHLEKVISILRAAKKIEVQNAVVTAKTQAKREVDSILCRLREEHEAEVREMRENYDDAKTLLYRREKEIERWGRMVYDQEVVIAALRLGVQHNSPRRWKSPEATENEELRAECARLKSQLEALRSLCQLYQDEADSAKSALVDAQLAVKSQTVEYERVTKGMETVIAAREKALIEDRDKAVKVFQDYKEEVEKELQLREELADRQSKYIYCLRNELQTAKAVIRSPRLRNKVLQRMRDMDTATDFDDLSATKTNATKARDSSVKTNKRTVRFPKESLSLNRQSRDSSPISPRDQPRPSKAVRQLPSLNSPSDRDSLSKSFF